MALATQTALPTSPRPARLFMISQTKPIKPYKLEAARPGQTDVTPLRQIVEAAVHKTEQDDKLRVLHLKSTAPSADQSPQPFLTTKFDSRREDAQERNKAPRRVAQSQHQKATECVSALVKPLQDLPGAKPCVRQASRSITDLCNTDNTKLFGVPCTRELLRQLKQIESEQQLQRASPQQPSPLTSSAKSSSPKPLPVPPLKLSPQEPSRSIDAPADLPSGRRTDRPRRERKAAANITAAASTPTTPLHSETSTEEGSEQSSPGTRKPKKTPRRKLQQQSTRYSVQDSQTARRGPEPYQRWKKNIASLQDLFFPEGPPKPASRSGQPSAPASAIGVHDAPPSPARDEPTGSPGSAPSTPTVHSPKLLGQMRVRPSLRFKAPDPESKPVSPHPASVSGSDDDKPDTPQPQPPQTDTQ